jgi:hypothetical protein
VGAEEHKQTKNDQPDGNIVLIRTDELQDDIEFIEEKNMQDGIDEPEDGGHQQSGEHHVIRLEFLS